MFYSSGLNQYDHDESHCIIKENQTHWYTSARVCEILTQRYIHLHNVIIIIFMCSNLLICCLRQNQLYKIKNELFIELKINCMPSHIFPQCCCHMLPYAAVGKIEYIRSNEVLVSHQYLNDLIYVTYLHLLIKS